MKKIAYIMAHDITCNDGVVKKIDTQINEWRKLGKIVKVFCVLPKFGSSDLEAEQYVNPGLIKQRFVIMSPLYEDVLEFQPDLVYYRYDLWNRTVAELASNLRMVCEINTNDIAENWLMLKERKTAKLFFRMLTVLLLRGKFLRKASGVVTVTRELSRMKIFTRYCTNIGIFANSIDLERYPRIKTEGCKSGRLAFFFMGTAGQQWHGVDIIESIALRLPNCDFHIVGINGESKDNIHYHGYLARDKYTEILKKCHICIGTLALHRKGLSEASPLKVREYLAYGFPVLLGYDDTSFLAERDIPWLYKVDGEPSIDDIYRFATENRGTVVSHTVLGCISSSAVEAGRIAFMEECARAGKQRRLTTCL